ncbi:hypothetical protein AAMO2058_000799100 [Amorphochlora amoebiformis]|uniref:Uncharacterized protein n=1 Tax=Amorphochlora amoebiformis TaxID=1561963 RepID=A0A7S0CV21_9EUKA|mmetsp:Transcript_14263/g.22633  ORF Transcript_14263/g.22633 Transcript_14263/m.22633 type:complete len:416 (+) Transcript_14263:65-1312(+)
MRVELGIFSSKIRILSVTAVVITGVLVISLLSYPVYVYEASRGQDSVLLNSNIVPFPLPPAGIEASIEDRLDKVRNLGEDLAILSNTTSSKPQPKLPRRKLQIALLYSGHVRSFVLPGVRNSHVENFIQPLIERGANITIFASIRYDDFFRGRAPFPSVNRSAAKSWFGELGARVVFETGSPETPNVPELYKERCEGWSNYKLQKEQSLQNLGRFWNTWRRVKEVYQLATKFEHTSGMRFDYIVRLRPDFLWMRRANISIVLDGADRPGDSDFSSNNSTSNPKSRGILWTPPASFIKAKQINDWAVFCRRDECDSYFNMIDTWENCTDGLCCWGWGPFYYKILNSTGIEARESFDLFPVLLVRKTYAACHRLTSFPEELGACVKLAKSLDIDAAWTCPDRRGKLHIHRSCGAPKG